MKELKVCLAATLMAGAISLVSLPQKTYAADVDKNNPVDIERKNSAIHKIQADIDADRDKIIEESKAINADRRKLNEARKIADKAEAEKIKQEINQDIEKREAVIKDLKKEISNKKDQKHDLTSGKVKKTPKPSRW